MDYNINGVKTISDDNDISIQGSRFKRMATTVYRTFSRRKQAAEEGGTRLARVLSAFDLTLMGVGSTLGVGVYVQSGLGARDHSGPSIIVSFFIAAIASLFAGLCYAEFGARVPKAGSAYVYSYVCVGEFIAFIIGWNLILEYVIGAASVVRALSSHLDALLNKAMSTYLEAVMPIGLPFFSPYPDFFAFAITMLFSAAIAFGAKESSKLNNMVTLINLGVVVFVVVSGAFAADFKNWQIDPASVVLPADRNLTMAAVGAGGFAPFGLAGIMSGAAFCFYAFIGFDCVATAGEEAKRPQQSIPIAVTMSLFIVFLAYFGVSTVVTMMLPYYLQDGDAPLIYVYDRLGWKWAKYIVTTGALCGLSSSLVGAIFPMPRVIYAMASDGLIFRFLGAIHGRYQTPMVGTLVAGFLTGVLAIVLDLKHLAEMMSIGTLLAYSMVAACVTMLRYEPSVLHQSRREPPRQWREVLGQLVNAERLAAPTLFTSHLVTFLVTFYGACCLALSGAASLHRDGIAAGAAGPCALLAGCAALAAAALYCISRQPVSDKKLAFTVPLVPWVPGMSILINVYLMWSLETATWIRFLIWITLGLMIYFGYGIRNSSERKPRHAFEAELEQLNNKQSSEVSLLSHANGTVHSYL